MIRWSVALMAVMVVLLAGCTAIVPGPGLETGTPAAPPAGATVADTSNVDIMPVDQLQPGMKGYGLTVFAGARPEKFDVEILSVLHGYEPQRDMILIHCAGHNLEKTGIAAGMSGSPIYINGKLIGALAYGWNFTVEPIAGVQPIEQMMWNSGLHTPLPPASQSDDSQTASAGGAGSMGGTARADGSIDLAEMFSRKPRAAAEAGSRLNSRKSGPGGPAEPTSLRPISTPLSVSGGSPLAMEYLRDQIAGSGLVAVRSGGSGAGAGSGRAADPRMASARLEPGGVLAIPLVSGDMDMTAIGTVTMIAGDRVLAFGHPMFGEGPVNLPMAIGIIHTFIPSIQECFKMGSAGRVIGAVRRDESTSICGVAGAAPFMTPMTVKVSAWDGSAQQVYHYFVADEWYFGARLAATAAMSSLQAQHGEPTHLAVYYKGQIKFHGHEVYKFAGAGSGSEGVGELASRIRGPIDAMLNNRWGKGLVESIDVDVKTINEERAIVMDRARLEQSVLLPGEPVVLHTVWKQYRKPDLEKSFRIDLPADLADGTYELSMLDADGYRKLMVEHDPRPFRPENARELIAGLNRLAEPSDDHCYFVLTLPKGGLAGRDARLPSLPASRAMILQQANRDTYRPYTEDKVYPQEMKDLIATCSEHFSITIDRNKEKKK